MLYSGEVIVEVEGRNSRMVKRGSGMNCVGLLFEVMILRVVVF